jgi:hypothetical protein
MYVVHMRIYCDHENIYPEVLTDLPVLGPSE